MVRVTFASTHSSSERESGKLFAKTSASVRPSSTERGTTPIHTEPFSRISRIEPSAISEALGRKTARVCG